MLYSTLVEIEVEVELGKNRNASFIFWGPILTAIYAEQHAHRQQNILHNRSIKQVALKEL